MGSRVAAGRWWWLAAGVGWSAVLASSGSGRPGSSGPPQSVASRMGSCGDQRWVGWRGGWCRSPGVERGVPGRERLHLSIPGERLAEAPRSLGRYDLPTWSHHPRRRDAPNDPGRQGGSRRAGLNPPSVVCRPFPVAARDDSCSARANSPPRGLARQKPRSSPKLPDICDISLSLLRNGVVAC